jgi:hypothetical protein
MGPGGGAMADGDSVVGGGEPAVEGAKARRRRGRVLPKGPFDAPPMRVSQVQYLGSSEQLLVVGKCAVPPGTCEPARVVQD